MKNLPSTSLPKKLLATVLFVILAMSFGSALAEEEVNPEIEAINAARAAAAQSCQQYWTYYTAYDWDSLQPLFKAYGDVSLWGGDWGVSLDELSDEDYIAVLQGYIDAVEEAKLSVVQVASFEDVRVDFWADPENVPTITDYVVNDGYYYDEPGFVPFMLHIPVAQGAEVKGAMIILGGGGRNNMQEGRYYATFFSEAGYQCFVMNNRLRPFSADESDADVQRAIRYLRENAQTYGIEPDQIIVAGNSAGGMRMASMLNGKDGTEVYPFDETYAPDEIDQINYMPNALIMTASRFSYTDESVLDPSSFPPIFFTCGADDAMALQTSYESALFFFELGVPYEIHTWTGVPHSLNMGYDSYSGAVYSNAAYWGELAVEWLDRALEMGRGAYVD